MRKSKTESTSHHPVSTATSAPHEHPNGVHIHVAQHEIYVDGEVDDDESKQSVLKACRVMAGRRRLVDQLRVSAG